MQRYYLIERLATAYKEHGILPDAGGMLDQDAGLMDELYLWLSLYYEEYRTVIAELEREH